MEVAAEDEDDDAAVLRALGFVNGESVGWCGGGLEVFLGEADLGAFVCGDVGVAVDVDGVDGCGGAVPDVEGGGVFEADEARVDGWIGSIEVGGDEGV